jgi:hypothetical protein
MLAEFSLTLLFLIIPLVGGGAYWLKIEWNRIQCANSTFSKARRELIQTGREVRIVQTCGGGSSRVSETVHLLPLEDLDHSKAALGIGELIREGSPL